MSISGFMASLLERLAEMFPGSNYQTRLETYLKNKGITDAVQLEHYIQQYERNTKEAWL